MVSFKYCEPHVIPVGDRGTHEAAQGCSCNPTTPDDPNAMVVHNAFDERELKESQGVKTPGWIKVYASAPETHRMRK